MTLEEKLALLGQLAKVPGYSGLMLETYARLLYEQDSLSELRHKLMVPTPADEAEIKRRFELLYKICQGRGTRKTLGDTAKAFGFSECSRACAPYWKMQDWLIDDICSSGASDDILESIDRLLSEAAASVQRNCSFTMFRCGMLLTL